MTEQSKTQMSRRALLAGALATGTVAPVLASARVAQADEAPANAAAPDLSGLKRVKVNLVAPPFVHEHVQATNEPPKIVEFTLTVHEKIVEIDDAGTKLNAFTFNGSMPGPLMVVHEGDYVELTLVNPDTNVFEHNIDLHASTGALGCGGLTHVQPGQKVTVRFKATRPGTFVYHCAPGGEMVPYHVVSGMNGAIMVLPRDGLKDQNGNPLVYDRIYYIGEQDLYIPKDKNGDYKTYKNPGDNYADMVEVMRTLTPTHEVFNGRVGALTGDNALKAKVGEKVLIVHSQANRDTRPHLIGGHGDYVWETGKWNNPPQLDQETWFIRGGSAGSAFYTFRQPGVYAYLNHNLIEAFDLGAVANFQVEGKWNDDLMTQVAAPADMT